MVAPYVQSLCTMVAEYIEHEGIEVVDRIALEIPDNLEVGRRDPMALVDIYKRLKLDGVDALVLSSCVQMPSLAAIPIVEQECGLPVVSASVCTTYQMLQKLGLKTIRAERGRIVIRSLLVAGSTDTDPATRSHDLFVQRSLVFRSIVRGVPASAQVDFSGEWAPRFWEDQPERVPGPELGDYLGIPISEAARHARRYLGRLDSDASRVAVSSALGRLHLARAVEPAHLQRGRSGLA